MAAGLPVGICKCHVSKKLCRGPFHKILLIVAGEKISAEYKLEYGSDRIEMHVGAIKQGQRVLLVDDLIATGGTLAAGIYLMEKVSMFL